MKDRRFIEDPILTAAQTKIHDIAHMGIAEHGRLIEHEIKNALHGRNGFTVWGEGEFILPTGGHAQVDLIVYDESKRAIRAYEIKRVSDKPQSSANLERVGEALKSYAETRDPPLQVATADTFAIHYYGKPNGDATRLTRETIDAHFGCEVRASVDDMTEKFRDTVQMLLQGSRRCRTSRTTRSK
jgi:hypothetical protein